ncbi:hypothetical protein ACQI5H_22860 [Mycobacterium heidelbergense]|uniref:hypothetical protein n=1 Tax=Mycobacterium heidelbergense TaxID=53376 RepID=UPI003CEF1041
MDISGMIGAAKQGVSLKLETPYMVAASGFGLLSVSCVLPGDSHFQTPLDGLSKFLGWAAGSLPATWLDAAHRWMTDHSRIDMIHGVCVLLALFGTIFASYSRASFASLLGFSGLVETGSTTQAWLIPVSVLGAMVVAGYLGRLWNDVLWRRAGWTCLWMLMALGYCLAVAITVVFGEQRAQDRPQSIELKLSWATRQYIDERLEAFGIRDLNPPVSIPPITASAAASPHLSQSYRAQENSPEELPAR